MTEQHDGHLAAVYAAKGPAEVAATYDAWAATYDAEMAQAGYRHPAIAMALLARHCPRGAGPVLDAGCGTGLVGEWLGLIGYGPLEGLDISSGMLEVARAKRVYAALHCLALGGELPFGNGAYAAVISTGVFTTGHVGAEALAALIRVCAAGGVLVLTVKDAVWNAGFAAAVAGFVAAGRIEVAEETPPYVSMPGEAGTSPGRALVLRVL